MRWPGLVTVSLIPLLMLQQVAGFAPLSTASAAPLVTDDGQAFKSGAMAPDREARRKVIVVFGLRLWGEARIDVRQELESNFSDLIHEMQEKVWAVEDMELRYKPSVDEDPASSYFSHNTDFISFSYTGTPVYWSRDTRQPLEESSRLLSFLVARARELYPNASLDLVGYSLGGLVILHWAQYLAEPEDLASLHSILLLATPVHGVTDSWLGDIYEWLCSCRILADIRRNSPLMRSLAIAEGIPNLVMVNNVNDWMVNGSFGDGVRPGALQSNVLLELRRIGEPVRRLTPTSVVQLMRNHTMILKDEPSVSTMARAVERICAQNPLPNRRRNE